MDLLIQRRREMMAGELSPEYQKVNYIENLRGNYNYTGNGVSPATGSYIDTGIHPELNDQIEIVFELASDYDNPFVAPYAVYSENKQNFGLVHRRGTTYYLMGNQKQYSSLLWYPSILYKVVQNKTSLTRNDTDTIIYDGSTSAFTAPSSVPLYLFTNAFTPLTNSINRAYVFKGKIYYMKYWKNGVLTNHFKPCYRKSDSTDAGFYDVIGKQFHGDASGDMGLTFG